MLFVYKVVVVIFVPHLVYHLHTDNHTPRISFNNMDFISKKLDKLKVEISRPRHSKPVKEYNVLLIGETQAGKSTLIQCMRKYADPSIEIDTKKIGTGFTSCTQAVATESIDTDLPEYYVKDPKDKRESGIDYIEFEKVECKFDYEDLLNNRRGLKVLKGSCHLDKTARFNLIDTPGLNATDGKDESNIRKIFEALKVAKEVHLILLVISSNRADTHGLKDAIKAYTDVFPGFGAITAIVRTHYNYNNFHWSSDKENAAMVRQEGEIHKTMKRKTVPRFLIDCDVYNKKPIRDCITQNTIQKILALADFNQSVDMMHTVVHKTRKMRDIDNVLKEKHSAASDTIEDTLRTWDVMEADNLRKTFSLEANIHTLESNIKDLDEFLVRHDVNVTEVLHEDRRDLDYASDDSKEMSVSCTPGEFDIKGVKELCHNVVVVNRFESKKAWRIDFEPTSTRHAVIHVKFYTIKSHLHRVEIEAKRKERDVRRRELDDARRVLAAHILYIKDKRAVTKGKTTPEGMDAISEMHNTGIRMVGMASKSVIGYEVFYALMDAEAYIGNAAVCCKKVEAVYKELSCPK